MAVSISSAPIPPGIYRTVVMNFFLEKNVVDVPLLASFEKTANDPWSRFKILCNVAMEVILFANK